MSNIAEGFESHTQPQFIKYLGYAKASVGEIRSQLYIAYDLGYLSKGELDEIKKLTEIISGQIYRFVQYLRTLPNSDRL